RLFLNRNCFQLFLVFIFGPLTSCPDKATKVTRPHLRAAPSPTQSSRYPILNYCKFILLTLSLRIYNRYNWRNLASRFAYFPRFRPQFDFLPRCSLFQSWASPARASLSV